MGTEGNLTPKQHRVIQLLALGRTREQAAHEAGVGVRTIYYWLQNPKFCAELERTENALWRSTISGLKSGISRSLGFLLGVLESPTTDNKDKLTAAKVLMGTAIRVIEVCELAELRERITKLESFILQERNGYDTRAEVKAR